MILNHKEIFITSALYGVWGFITILIINTTPNKSTKFFIFGLMIIQLIISYFLFSK
jgi:hypothetical protein